MAARNRMNSSDQRRRDEVEALESIYGEDFVHYPATNSSQEKMELTVHPDTGGGEEYVTCKLTLSLPKDYPSTKPASVIIKNLNGLADKQVQELQEEMTKKCRELKGREVGFVLVKELEDLLTKFNVPPPKSFFDQMHDRQRLKEMERIEREKQLPEKASDDLDAALGEPDFLDEQSDHSQTTLEQDPVLLKELEDNLDRARSLQEAAKKERLEKRKVQFYHDSEDTSISSLDSLLEPTVRRGSQPSPRSESIPISRHSSKGSLFPMPSPSQVNLPPSSSQNVTSSSSSRPDHVVKWTKLNINTTLPSPSLLCATYLATMDKELVQVCLFELRSKTLPGRARLDGAKDRGLHKWLALANEIQRTSSKLSKLRHENVVRFYGMLIDSSAESILTLELACAHHGGNTLAAILNAVKVFDVEMVRVYTRHILCGLEYLHRNEYVHGDLVLASVFISPQGKALLGFPSVYRSVSDLVHQAANGSIDDAFPRLPPSKMADFVSLGFVVLQMSLGTLAASHLSCQGSVPVVTKEILPHDEARSFILNCFGNDGSAQNEVRLSSHDFVCIEGMEDSSHLDTPFGTEASSPEDKRLRSPVTAKGDDLMSSFGSPRTFAPMPLQPSLPVSSLSRYQSDFEEMEFVGKGGFGAVIKARNKLDQRIYAIKAIRLDQKYTNKIMREVSLLSRLSHPNVVRYFQAWIEDGQESFLKDSESEDEEDEEGKGEGSISASRASHSRSRHVDNLFFGGQSFSFDVTFEHGTSFDEDEEDDDVDDDDDEEENEDGDESEESETTEGENSNDREKAKPKNQKKRKSKEENSLLSSSDWLQESTAGDTSSVYLDPNGVHTPYLYIQMEFCDNRTLRDLIVENQLKEESDIWRVFREIAEGLAHIHQQKIIHRDLKPLNILIDHDGHVKIGDFGLAVFSLDETMILNIDEPKSVSIAGATAKDSSFMTSNIGTALYVAPELDQQKARVRYNNKVDMYSLGIIFFEMCHPFKSMHERAVVIEALRTSNEFPVDFKPSFTMQRTIITRLLEHNPSHRLSCQELLEGDFLPADLHDDSLQTIVRALKDPSQKSKVLATLFGLERKVVDDYVYEPEKRLYLMEMAAAREHVRSTLIHIFALHGAIDVDVPLLVPLSPLIDDFPDTVHLMDSFGSYVQLPYNLRVPFARFISRQGHITELKRYVFGKVFRNNNGYVPKEIRVVHFDVVSPSTSAASLVAEVEVFHVLVSILTQLLPHCPLSIVIGHRVVLEAAIRSCGVSANQVETVVKILKERGQSNEVMKRVSFRKSFLSNGFSSSVTRKLEAMFSRSFAVSSAVEGISNLFSPEIASQASVKQAIVDLAYFFKLVESLSSSIPVVVQLASAPQSSDYSSLYFHCVLSSSGHAIAAGGRYNKLVTKFELPPGSGALPRKNVGIVGLELALDRVVSEVANSDKKNRPPPLRAGHYKEEVVVCTPSKLDKAILQSMFLLARDLWGSGLNVHIVPETLVNLEKLEGVRWTIILKDAASKASNALRLVKIKSAEFRVEEEVQLSSAAETIIARMGSEEREKKEEAKPAVSESRGDNIDITILFDEKPTQQRKRLHLDLAHAKVKQFAGHVLAKGRLETIVTNLPPMLLLEYISKWDLTDFEMQQKDIQTFIQGHPKQADHLLRINAHILTWVKLKKGATAALLIVNSLDFEKNNEVQLFVKTTK